MLTLSYLILYCAMTLSQGSKIQFVSKPKIISDRLSRTLTLRCSLSDTSAGMPTIQGEKGFIQTSENIKYVTSIVISKFNSEIYVAGINRDNQISSGNNTQISRLAGDIKARSGSGYLDAEWTKPNSSESGNYYCEITAQYSGGRSVRFKASINVGITQPTVFELSERVFEAEKFIQDGLDKDVQIKIQGAEHTSWMNKLRAAGRNIQRRVPIAEESSKTKFKPHLEANYVECGDSNNWYVYSGGYKKAKKHVTFSRPYNKAPTVLVQNALLNSDNERNLRFDFIVTDVTRKGFNVICSTWSNTIINRITFYWISLDYNAS